MKLLNIKEKIKSLKESQVLDAILIKGYERHRDEENYKERIAKQRAIIAKAEEAITKIQKEYEEAGDKIAEVEKFSRYNKRVLVELLNYEKIEALKTIAKKLQEVKADGKDDNNQKR